MEDMYTVVRAQGGENMTIFFILLDDDTKSVANPRTEEEGGGSPSTPDDFLRFYAVFEKY